MERDAQQAWRLRPVLLALLGAIAALILQQLLDTDVANGSMPPPGPGRVAFAALVATGSIGFAFTVERLRWWWAAIFAVVVGVVAGLVTWWNGGPGYDVFWDWRSFALFLSIAITAPLFQTARDEGAARFPYAEVHGHAWTNVVLWFASWAFAGIAFAMAFLLSELFQLIGINVLRDLMRDDWFVAILLGGSLGGALGLFRERDRIIRLLQRVVTAVLSVLAPVLGVALLLFLASLPFTGLDALWEATKATTPILLSCVIGALILANAVIGNGEEEELANPALRWGAMALAAAMMPLAVIAAVATGLRIGQYGFTPDRLWGLTFVIVACAYGLTYLVALVRGRQGWALQVRPANLKLAFALAGLALFLALPIVSFNAVSTRDQVARLQKGRVSPEKFDWAALAFDFGEPGKRALASLRNSPNAKVARLASDAATKTNRYEAAEVQAKAQTQASLPSRLRVLPVATTIPAALAESLTDYRGCGMQQDEKCTIIYTAGAGEALAVQDACIAGLAPKTANAKSTEVASDCAVGRLVLRGAAWEYADSDPKQRSVEARRAIVAGLAASALEVRPVRRRQLFVGGQPVGSAFE